MNRNPQVCFDPSSPVLRRVFALAAVAATVATLGFIDALAYAYGPLMARTATPAGAAGKCDNPNGSIERRACAKAAEGPDSLRRFVERTRSIYSLYYYDFAKGEAVAAAPTPPQTVAEAKAP